ncbi:MAG: DUF3515 family protein [Pseudonocardiaceae bacterium]|nr:DUF3515 family protein [Pseudonocardiaceae bacterium]
MPDEPGGLPRPVIITAVALCGVLAAGAAVLGLVFGSGEQLDNGEQPAGREPLIVPAAPAPGAGSPRCDKVMRAMPATLVSEGDRLRRLKIARPAPPSTIAWGSAEHEPLILRCGVGRPAELTRTSPLRVVSRVQWLVVERPGTATWYAVDRKVYLALTVPSDAGTGPLQTISKRVRATLPPAPLPFG